MGSCLKNTTCHKGDLTSPSFIPLLRSLLQSVAVDATNMALLSELDAGATTHVFKVVRLRRFWMWQGDRNEIRKASKVGESEIRLDIGARGEPGACKQGRSINPSCSETELPGGHMVVIEALRHVQYIGRRHFETPQNFVEMGFAGLITLHLLGRHYHVESCLQSFLGLREQGVVCIRDNRQAESFGKALQRVDRVRERRPHWEGVSQ